MVILNHANVKSRLGTPNDILPYLPKILAAGLLHVSLLAVELPAIKYAISVSLVDPNETIVTSVNMCSATIVGNGKFLTGSRLVQDLCLMNVLTTTLQ